jgi:CheY-like chemotaxis protein
MVNKKILIADDNQMNRELLGDVLQRFQPLGVEVLYAVNGTQAWEIMQKEKPALLFLDLMMPDMSGHEVTRKIKGDEALKATHIIVVSARTEQEDGKESQEAGADDYITKPYDIREIRQKVKAFLEKTEALSAGAKPPDPPPPTKAGGW